MAESATLHRVLLVGGIGGFLFGLHIGYAGVAMEFVTAVGNCTRYESMAACSAVPMVCEWADGAAANDGRCLFKDQLAPNQTVQSAAWCALGTASKEACTAIPHCVFQHGACIHDQPWTPLERGVFASILVIGGMIGALTAGTLMARLGARSVLALAGVGAFVTAVLLTFGWQLHGDGTTTVYPLMVAGRFVAGVAMGVISVASPIYVDTRSPTAQKKWTGMVFQLALTFGILTLALSGLSIFRGAAAGAANGPTGAGDNLRTLFQIVNGLLIAVALAQVAVAFTLPRDETDGDGDVDGDVDDDSERPLSHPPTEEREMCDRSAVMTITRAADVNPRIEAEERRQGWKDLRLPIIAAVALSAVQQLTGINAIMNYAPTLSHGFGMEPLDGNACIMAWNFVTCIASLKISTLLPPTRMYVTFAFVASLACIVAAIPTFPAVFRDPNDPAGQTLTATGIALFIAAFEMGMGPCFYVLAHQLFPPWWRETGCSFTIVTQFVFNIVINWCYPLAVQSISGGENADQRLGIAAMFLFFGVVGTASTAVLAAVFARKQRAELEVMR